MGEESAVDSTRAELDQRKSGTLEVSLLWHRDLDAVSLTIRDDRSGKSLEIPVARDRALQAFRHPFAYAASIGIDYVTNLTPPDRRQPHGCLERPGRRRCKS
jgi:hypothetical protein